MAVKKKVAKKKVAKKKTAKKKAGKAVATLNKNKSIANFKERLAGMAGKDADRGHSMGESNYISTKGGIFTYQGNEIPNPFYAIITDFTFENAYYDSIYDPDQATPPACFALSDDPETLVAHPTSPDMQGGEGNACEGCEMDEWETSNTGRGKACKNGVRLALVNADDPAKVNAASEPAFIRIAPTSLKHFEKYKDKFTRVTGMPLLAAMTEVELVPVKTWYEVHFTLVDQIEDEQMLQNMLSIHDAYEDLLREPYDVTGYDAPKPSPRRGAAKKKVAKKKAAPKKKSARAKY